jgi:putative hydrolase of the HAD superfamily
VTGGLRACRRGLAGPRGSPDTLVGVNWVMFDYGGVLSQAPADEDVARLARVAGAGVPSLMDEYWQWRRAYDLAELDTAEYWRRVGSGLGRSYSQAQTAELSRLDSAMWLRLQAGTVALVRDLAAAGVPLALLSNAPADVAEAVSGLAVCARFRHLIFSCELKTGKPDPECYQAALARLGARAQDVIFIDDRPENVAGAAALGLRSVRFTTPAQAREAVTRLQR